MSDPRPLIVVLCGSTRFSEAFRAGRYPVYAPMPIGEFSLYYGDFTDMAGEGHWLGLPPSERVREGTTVPTDDDELLRLLSEFAHAMHDLGQTDDTEAPYGLERYEMGLRAEKRRAALLAHIEREYVRRDSGKLDPYRLEA